jgi:hypothetical protein
MESRLVTLEEAARLYPFKVSTLRNQVNNGKLVASRIGKRLFVTTGAIEDMVEKCRVEPKARVCISTGNEANGLSETDQISGARAALQTTLKGLKGR